MRSLPEILVSLATNILILVLWFMVHALAVGGAFKLLIILLSGKTASKTRESKKSQEDESNFWIGWAFSLFVLIWFYSKK